MELKQFVPQKDCERCEVCCRFSEQHTVWAPKFTQEEIAAAVAIHKIPPLLFSAASSVPSAHHRPAQRINLLHHKQEFRCPCFAPPTNKCLIYPQRPFECQLYPFLLLEKDGQFFLALDKKCLALKKSGAKALRAHKHYLEATFQQREWVSFLSRHRDLFSRYDPHDLEIVFPISLDTFIP